MSSLQERMANKAAQIDKDITKDIKATEAAVEAKLAHVQALEQGLRVFAANSLRKFSLPDGKVVRPTAEGFYIALTEGMEKELNHFHSKGLVEEVKEVAVTDK